MNLEIPNANPPKANRIEPCDWYKRKPYLHFDSPLSLKKAMQLVEDADQVAKHAFYPLIRYTLKSRRLKTPISKHSPERSWKLRNISYPAHKDGYIYSYYQQLLNAPYETWVAANDLAETVTAFRKTSKNNIKLAKEAFDYIKESPGCAILATDIESYFDRIDHQYLKQKWCRFLAVKRLPKDHYAVFRAVTNFSFVHQHKVYNALRISHKWHKRRPSNITRLCGPQVFRQKIAAKGLIHRNEEANLSRGIPQGLSISPLLSNMYLCDVDLGMHSIVSELKGRYWRYCDDILVVVPNADSLQKVQVELEALLKEAKVGLHPDKTTCVDNSALLAGRPLEYLGFAFNGTKVTIRPSSIQRFRSRVKKCLDEANDVRDRETSVSGVRAPLRVRKLYNLYGDGVIKGIKAKEARRKAKFAGSFATYVGRCADVMNSEPIRRQRYRALKYVSIVAQGKST